MIEGKHNIWVFYSRICGRYNFIGCFTVENALIADRYFQTHK